MTRRAVVSVVVLLVGMVGLVGCGNPEGDYCAALQKSQSLFSDDGSGVQLVTNLAQLRVLAQAAPNDLADEWQTLLAALGALDDAIRAAGVRPQDFVDGHPPASVSAAHRAAIAAAANEVAAADVVDAAAGIDQQARDVCKFQLGLGG